MPSVDEDSQVPSAKCSCENFLEYILPNFSQRISCLDLQYCRPKFSIRDYVRSMRGKNLKENWPFSTKSLQLCIKHKVKNVLPSFHEAENGTKAGVSEKKHLIEGCVDARSCKYLDENEVFQAEVESPPAPKKRKLIVKLSGKSGCFSAEESAGASDSNSMASKVCPVCKAFSSSSNTTLNAHIDQCLSAQTAPLVADGCKLPRQKRKKRLMTDVYATAKHCTVEDLELRNGITCGKIEGPHRKPVYESKEEGLPSPAFVLGNNSKGRRSSLSNKKSTCEKRSFTYASKLYRSSRAIVDKARRFSSFRRRILYSAKIKEHSREEILENKNVDEEVDPIAEDFSTFSKLLEIPPESFTEGFCTDTFEGGSFPAVDPISIPGPPGSYLPPSPEDFQVADSRVQSSIDLPEVVDGDSSDSTISNSISLRLNSLQQNPPLPQLNDAVSHTEMGFHQFKNDQHCCCQRKETYLNCENQANWQLANHNGGFSNCDSVRSSSNPILRLMGKNLMVMNKDGGSGAQMSASCHNHRADDALAIGESSNGGQREEDWWRETLRRPSTNYGGFPRPNLVQQTRTSQFSNYATQIGTSSYVSGSPPSLYPLRPPSFYYHPAFGINFVDDHSTLK